MPKAAKSPRIVPVVDLFAGPGGLAEGFDALRVGDQKPFDVRLSIEKEAIACETLKLRTFSRQFNQTPPELAAYFAGEAPLSLAQETYPREASIAFEAVWHAELGKTPATEVAARVRSRVNDTSNWVLLGGPPCQAYSIAGRSRMRTTRPDFEKDERHFLYREYLRIVAEHQPAVFVLENVKGLLTSEHQGDRMVTRILEDLWDPARALGIGGKDAQKYRLYPLGQRQSRLFWEDNNFQDGEEYVLRAEEFGIPQSRHRIFIVGVRSDVIGRPSTLERQPPITVGDVIGDLPAIRSRLSREDDSFAGWMRAVETIRECRWMSERRGDMAPISREVRRVMTKLMAQDLGTGARYVEHNGAPSALADWFRKGAMGLTHHEARAHMRADLHRYLFASASARLLRRSPELKHFPAELRPAHLNVREALDGGDMFSDRFRVQLRDKPSTTITSHISKDGHYYIHYDPVQCRSLTVREAARLQTFPDNYFFEGNRTEQYHQIGNAVPPLLAMQIARSVHDLLVAAARLPSTLASMKSSNRKISKSAA